VRFGRMALFEDTFEVTAVDPDGKKFTKVSRIVCHGENYEMDLVLDINSELYKVPLGTKLTVVLASTLNLDLTTDEKTFNQSGDPSLMDSYEYVMHGKVFKVSTEKNKAQSKMEVFASYGGLLMSLKGDPRNLQKIALDMRIYLLMRKVQN